MSTLDGVNPFPFAMDTSHPVMFDLVSFISYNLYIYHEACERKCCDTNHLVLKTNFDKPCSFPCLFPQDVKRAVVGYFQNNGTTGYLSFAKVSHHFFPNISSIQCSLSSSFSRLPSTSEMTALSTLS